MSRFATVGGVGLLVNQVLFWLLVSEGGLHYLLGAVFATVGSTTFNFVGTESWVFRGRRSPQLAGIVHRFIAFAAVNWGSLIFRLPLLFVLASGLHLNYFLANFVTLIALSLARFVLSDALIWSKPRVAERGP
jgi:dolichol-phosphate mannosyltransferase